MFEDFNGVFNNSNENTTSPSETPVQVDNVSSGKASLASNFRVAYAKYIASHPEVGARKGSLSSSLEITRVLGYGEPNGNIIHDANATKATGKRKLVGVTAIVGYVVRNRGNVPMKIKTEKFVKDQNGLYVGTPCEEVLAPGAEMQLSRKYFAMNGVKPEFGANFYNGILVLRDKADITTRDVNETLEKASFRFDKENGLQVHDDAVKDQIGTKASGSWQVLDNYVETFGYLMNAKTKVSGSKKAKSKVPGDLEVAAHLIYNQLKGAGIV